MQQLSRQKTPQLKFIAIASAASAVILVLTVTPWNIVPISVTEDVKVIAVTDYGCVAESVMGHSVVIPDCKASAGETVSAEFYVPAMEQNGYYDRIHEKLAMVSP